MQFLLRNAIFVAQYYFCALQFLCNAIFAQRKSLHKSKSDVLCFDIRLRGFVFSC